MKKLVGAWFVATIWSLVALIGAVGESSLLAVLCAIGFVSCLATAALSWDGTP